MMAGLYWPAGSTVEEQESWIDKSANRVLSHLYQLELSSLPIFQCNIRIHILLMELLREYFFVSVNRLLLNKASSEL